MAAPTIKVGVLGATGRTGESIVDGLLGSSETKFEVTSLTRPSSLGNDDVRALERRGVRIAALDLLGGSAEDFARALAGLDVLVSAVSFEIISEQARLLEAVKAAGIKRFVPAFWGTPAPRGEQNLLDLKLDVLAAVQRLYIPYTVIDVGWWTQQVVPKVPSGRTSHAAMDVFGAIVGDGNVPNALTDVRDIGRYTAKIITDPRTLNRFVLAYTEVFTYNQIYDLMDELSGEKSARKYLSAESIRGTLAAAKGALEKDPADKMALFTLIFHQYLDSWGLRGHNTPAYAGYLGYLDSRELYPGLPGRSLRSLFEDVLAGGPSGYRNLKMSGADALPLETTDFTALTSA